MPTTLARLLVEAGLAPQEAADAALRRHVSVGGALDTVLLEDRVVDEGKLLEALEAAAGLPAAHPDAYARFDPKALVAFPFKVADRYGMVPMALGKRHVDVAVSYPVEKLLLEEISFMLGKDLRPHISIEVRIRAAIAQHYKKPLAARFSNLLRELGPPRAQVVAPPPAAPPAAPTPVSTPAPAATPAPEPVAVSPTEPEPSSAQTMLDIPALPTARPRSRSNEVALPTSRPPSRSSEFQLPAARPPSRSVDMPRPPLVARVPTPPPVPARPVEVELVIELERPSAPTARLPALDPSSPFATASRQVEQSLPAPRLSWAEEGPSPFEMDSPTGEEDVRVEDELVGEAAPETAWEPPSAPVLAAAPSPSSERPPISPALVAAANAIWDAPPPPSRPPVTPPPIGPPPLPLRRSAPQTAEVPIAPNSAPSLANSAPATAMVTLPEPPPYPEPPPFPEAPPLEVFAEEVFSGEDEDVRIEAGLDDEAAAPAPEAATGESTPAEEAPVEVGDESIESEAPHPLPPAPSRLELNPPRPVTPMSISVPVLAPPHSDDGGAQPRKPGNETMERMLVWDTGSSSLGSIESALASADLAEIAAQIYGTDDRPFLVAPTDAPPLRVDPAAAPGTPLGSAAAAKPAVWSLTMARQKLAEAPGRDQIIEVALRFALKSFEFAAALAVKGGTAFGWHALGSEATAETQVHAVALPLDAPSVLRTVLRARGRYLGPLPDDELTRKLLVDLGRDAPTVALVYPVFVRERVVAFFYADRGTRHVAAARVAEFLLFAQEIATSFERAILNNKRGTGMVRAVAVAPLLTSSALPRISRDALTVSSPGPFLTGGARGPAPVSDEAFFDIDEVPPEVTRGPRRSVEAMIDDLISPDRRRRLAALSELSLDPATSAPALAARFPGPTAMRRGLVDDLPEPEEIGPIANALVRAGASAVPHLARLIREGDPDTRFFAVLLVGWMKSADLLPGLFLCLFDPVLEVGAGARSAARQLRTLPDFEIKVARPLRAELSGADPDRISAAAKALGRVRDVVSIGLLIPLTGHPDDRVVAEATDALTLLTKQALGDSPRRWQAWLDANKNRPRLAWLIDGLSHRDLQIRLASIEELAGETNDNFGFFADAPKKDREKAIQRWTQWLASRN